MARRITRLSPKRRTSLSELVIPGAEDRTIILGTTGDGKTVMGAWLLGKQRFEKRSWVCIDYKNEVLWDDVGSPPMRGLRLGDMPGKRGLYRMHVNPGQEDLMESWLWKIWRRGNVGLFCDEASLLPKQDAVKAILRQGRSKLIPVIACSQRPVDCDREFFSEAQYRVLFGIGDMHRDYPVIRGLFGNADVRKPLPRFWSYWYDLKRRQLHTLRPVPSPDNVVASLKKVAPRSLFLGA